MEEIVKGYTSVNFSWVWVCLTNAEECHCSKIWTRAVRGSLTWATISKWLKKMKVICVLSSCCYGSKWPQTWWLKNSRNLFSSGFWRPEESEVSFTGLSQGVIRADSFWRPQERSTPPLFWRCLRCLALNFLHCLTPNSAPCNVSSATPSSVSKSPQSCSVGTVFTIFRTHLDNPGYFHTAVCLT